MVVAAKSQNRPSTCGFASGPPGTRTRNLRIKSPLLYPIELEAREGEYINPIGAVRWGDRGK